MHSSVGNPGVVSKRKPASANSPLQSPPRQNITGWDVAVVVLFLCRWIVPAEGVELGQTLWIAAAWLALASLRFWILWRSRAVFPLRWGLADAGVGALIAGHCLSGLLVWGQGGDVRAALNCCWEWVSIGVMWLLLRERWRQAHFPHYFSFCLLVTLVILSGWGLWQHFVWYPQQSRDLTRLLQLQEELDTGRTLAPVERSDFERLRNHFGPEVLGLEAGGKAMLLARTRDSREPIGRFALANTFAALLILGWFLTADLLIRSLGGKKGAIAVCLLLVTSCLFLSKSRTAVIGLCGGLSLGGVLLLVSSRLPARRLMVWAGVMAAGGVVVGLVLILSGGLDRQILSEAPKSLAYRMEYWESTWKMIMDHPVFGVGPGNFRQHYFAYKLPGASEEILDPHQMFLDVWANGGLLALSGLLILLGQLVRCGGRTLFPLPHPEDDSLLPGSVGTVLLTGAATFLLVGGEEWLLEGFVDGQLLWLGGSWLMLAAILFRALPPVSMSSLTAAMTALALCIHLLGAGGIGMPAILQLLLFLLLALMPAERADHPGSRRLPVVMCVSCGCLLIGCLWSGLVPVVTVGRLLDQGRQEAYVSHHLQQAAGRFREAVAADSLAAAPHDELAALAFERWKRDGGDNEDLFTEAILQKEQALKRNPLAAKEYLTLSGWWLQRSQRRSVEEYAREAVRTAEKGVTLYPNFVRMHVQLAEACFAAGDVNQAREAAKRALFLDDLNRERGHSDKMLPARQRDRLEEIAGVKQEKEESQ